LLEGPRPKLIAFILHRSNNFVATVKKHRRAAHYRAAAPKTFEIRPRGPVDGATGEILGARALDDDLD
jgi:hypothetical protein